MVVSLAFDEKRPSDNLLSSFVFLAVKNIDIKMPDWAWLLFSASNHRIIVWEVVSTKSLAELLLFGGSIAVIGPQFLPLKMLKRNHLRNFHLYLTVNTAFFQRFLMVQYSGLSLWNLSWILNYMQSIWNHLQNSLFCQKSFVQFKLSIKVLK